MHFLGLRIWILLSRIWIPCNTWNSHLWGFRSVVWGIQIIVSWSQSKALFSKMDSNLSCEDLDLSFVLGSFIIFPYEGFESLCRGFKYFFPFFFYFIFLFRESNPSFLGFGSLCLVSNFFTYSFRDSNLLFWRFESFFE